MLEISIEQIQKFTTVFWTSTWQSSQGCAETHCQFLHLRYEEIWRWGI
jgi:hypothetical protein